MNPIRYISFSLVALGLMSLPLAAVPEKPSSAGATLAEEEWGVIEFGGKRIGFMSTVTSERQTAQGKQYISATHEEFKLNRMGTTIHIISGGKVTEDANGTVINFETYQRGAGTNKKVRGYRVGDQIVVVSGRDKRSYDMPTNALGPAATERRVDALPMEKGAATEISSFLADMPHAPMTLSVTNAGRTQVEVKGAKRDLWRFTTTLSALPGITTDIYTDDQRNAVLTTMPLPGLGEFRVLTATREEAMKELEAAEMFVQTLVEPSRAMPDYRRLQKATYRLTSTSGKDLNIYDGENQKRIDSHAGTTTVLITVPSSDSQRPTYSLPYKGDAEMEDFLASSSFVENTPTIRKLAGKAVAGEKNPQQAAQKIERFVRDYIKAKDLSVSFASAEETAKSRAGDCTEHAVLCAAMGRAIGLPTRVVTGLGYLPVDFSGQGTKGTGNFGFHMWAEAYLGEGKWQTMDAALDGLTVGHIALTKSALSEANPTVELSMPIFNIIAGLEIEVVDTQ